MISISHIDHLVLTVKNIPTTIEFYTRVLGMQAVQFGSTADNPPRTALTFGHQNINLHEAGCNFKPIAEKATPGSADLCLITKTPIDKVIEHINSYDVKIIEGPVERTGATGKLLSIYIRDPNLNLIEISNQV
jgi:catechol 2,3-dioxygenase-like lactoylglutathione lyase family enzyme